MEDNNNLLSYYYEDGRTMYQLFHRGLKVSGGHHLLSLSYSTLHWIWSQSKGGTLTHVQSIQLDTRK